MADLIDMPKLSDTMSVGTLIKWLKQEGDAVQAGDMLAEIETDKATMELETFFTGTLIKIYAEAGSQVAIGAPLCAIGKPGEAAPTPPVASAAPPPPPAPVPAAPVVTAPAPVAAPVPVPAPTLATVPAAASPTSADRLKISPLARKIAADQKIDPTHLTGSGPGGRIVKADVLAAAANPLPAVAPKAVTVLRTGPIQAERTVPATNMRATIAKRLLEAKTQIPHFYLEIEVDADPLLTVRAQLNTALETAGVKLSVNDFILKASAEALRRVPGVNASWTGAGIQYHGAAHVSFAVAIDDGLITPVIRDAHLKSVFAISTEVKPLGQRAKQKKLKPEEFTGGTFCVSNLGMMGIPKFSAIINPPNAAILAVGTTVTKPVVKNGAIVIGQTMTLTLSCDHRVVDGALGAQFLAALKDLLEKPALLLV
ncbi:MAG: pyruvate dehydrogenase complex dihydrolipoamide acetyltransferase [Opitutia bacterium Tous-C10FEB]|nr:MAG: pyruvate dehydrogenase complex dihydrolipoamide acetyltransferase [Opitutae bacterium Tous-C10FEB]